MKKLFFGKNLKFLRKSKNLNQAEMLDTIGFNGSTWSGYELEKSFPKFEDLLKISEYFGINEYDLIHVDLQNVHLNEKSELEKKGKNVHLNVHPNVHLNAINEPIANYEITIKKGEKDAKNTAIIPITDIAVAAGAGIYNESPIEVADSLQLPPRLVKPGHTYLCVKIKGKSMSPTLQDGGYVVIRLLDKGNWHEMPDERIFVVIDTDGKSYLKRVKNRFKQGFIVLKSDSPDKATFPSFNLENKEIAAIWYIEWYFSAKMPNIHDQFYTRLQQLEDRVDELAHIKRKG